MKLKITFAQNLKNARKRMGFTQEEMARKAGFSVRYMQFLEGKNPPNVTLDTIEKLAKKLKVKPYKLLE